MSQRLLSISGNELIEEPFKSFLGASTSISNFTKLNQLGEGSEFLIRRLICDIPDELIAYGVVHRAVDVRSSQIVALKSVRIFTDEKRDGIPTTALREVSLLRILRHENVIRILDVAVADDRLDEIYMVLEYAQHDIAYLLDHHRVKFTASEIKCLMLQLFEGLEYIHSNGIIHRDLKMSNLLLSSKGVLKIADFGMARGYVRDDRPLTPAVVTIWYRPPELLFGAKRYGAEVDMWSAGCVMGELLLAAPLLPGSTELEQIDLITRLLGPPNERIWPAFRTLPGAKSWRTTRHDAVNTLNKVLREATQRTIELVNALLTYDPLKRATAYEAMDSGYFREAPRALEKGLMPTFPEIRNESAEISSGSKATTEKQSVVEGSSHPLGNRKQHKESTIDTYKFEFNEEDLLDMGRSHKRLRSSS
ncbi:kinase-like domain-containing protein [Dipodascopsis tothii]|uniref:kinase-like domain-containing protein n=1 Tax=Dipodascopsis tothii TaxID=44089 RepID=UPI0034CE2429